jgi:hypothetical protein
MLGATARSSPRWPTAASRRRTPLLATVPCRTVTDIEFYKEVDQSHLHLKEAQSHMRKFHLKMKETEMEKERERKGGSRGNRRREEKGDDLSPVDVPKYIERRPDEILR